MLKCFKQKQKANKTELDMDLVLKCSTLITQLLTSKGLKENQVF